ncbi:trehalase family glycosidase [uncultured Lacinutrix sp.]|uniref:MGH1-like glycoside hydrolase domain-containing protein n=1 Tax=uncultured Lacinutrix sp. TaxID=574032 RepID=UPI00260EE1CF|nr:trehalase family glycosidase [uncultured Lacinutrix sp.]
MRLAYKKIFFIIFIIILISNCSKGKEPLAIYPTFNQLYHSENILDYRVSPKDSIDRSGLMFSDQGAWFAYSLPDSKSNFSGFSGPFLMTQQNGIWSSQSLAKLSLKGKNNTNIIDWNSTLKSQHSYSSHLVQVYKNKRLYVKQELVYASGHTALQKTTITNISSKGITLHPSVSGELFDIDITVSSKNETIVLSSKKSKAKGYLKFPKESVTIMTSDNYYNVHFDTQFLEPGKSKSYLISQSFIFPEYSWEDEKSNITNVNFDTILNHRKIEKNKELKALIDNQKYQFKDSIYKQVLAKSHLTLQNNWRIPAGEIKHEGLFPSYHYKWFNGFWSWDSWKHAVGLSYYNIDLAKKQVKLMFEFQNNDGFVADCVYRDTLIESHNYRDTKPPLSAWAVVKIYKKDKDIDFVKELYPKLKKYHQWWYNKRDHDKDGLCEYGSTDGSLIAAKWESGMDNAIRFDNSKILKNTKGAYSLNQESIDLNAYLYAEKLFLSYLAHEIKQFDDSKQYTIAANTLKYKIQKQFYDKNDGWFYDTNLSGNTFIKGEGSEGWIALWANVATQKQAETIKNKMMNPKKFFTKVPFQTMSADHSRFAPLEGYWRGPNWLDQAYFGVKGLRNYGYNKEANKATTQIISGAEGILGKGKAIRENYHPLTGKGLNAQNFSWSAAHLIMLLQNN